MGRKLSDAEFVERTRAGNRKRAERQRQRLEQSGLSALTVWVPSEIRAALTAKAANDGSTIAETATALLSAALTTTTNPATPEPEPADNTASSNATNNATSNAERDRQILELHSQGLSNVKVGERLGCNEASVRRALKRLTATKEGSQ